MENYREIIDLWPNRGEFGRDVGIGQPYANTMHLRNKIPANHWKATVDAARKRGFKGVTLELLARLNAN